MSFPACCGMARSVTVAPRREQQMLVAEPLAQLHLHLDLGRGRLPGLLAAHGVAPSGTSRPEIEGTSPETNVSASSSRTETIVTSATCGGSVAATNVGPVGVAATV